MTTTVEVKLDDEIGNRLKTLAVVRQCSSHWLMREAILKYLDEEESINSRNREADAAWNEYQRTGRAVSHEEVTAWLDSWGSSKESPSQTPVA